MNFQLTDYVYFSNDSELWASVEWGQDSLNNTIITPQFNYTFYKKEVKFIIF